MCESREVRFAYVAHEFDLILKTICLCDGGDAAKERIDLFVPKIERQICLLLRIERQLPQHNETGICKACRARCFAHRHEIEPLFEQRIRRVGKPAACKTGIEPEAILRVAGDKTQASTEAALSICQRPLTEIVQRQQ